ncbi:MAG: S8 family serine peptidase [Pyrinomonadaceae bacterium]
MLASTRNAHFPLIACLAVFLLAVVFLALTVDAGKGGAAAETAEQSFERKADKLTKMVRRAAREEVGGKGRAGGRQSRLERLSRIAAVKRRADGGAALSLHVKLKDRKADQLKAAGFLVGSLVGDIATVETTTERLSELAVLSSVRKIELGTISRAMNDVARQAVKIDSSAGQRQIGQDGTGVVVGIIDSGIDFRHLDFTVPGSGGKQTRIKYLLDMTRYEQSGPDWDLNYTLPEGTTPIGRLYTEAQINEALQIPGRPSQADDKVKQRDKSGHGTHIAGTAAGNGLADNGIGQFAGMAPKADLIIVKATRDDSEESGFNSSDQINALSFIRLKSEELGRPFVANLSLGGHTGPHNGTNFNEEAIDALVDGGTGRAVCVAAGNEGNDDMHASGYIPQGGEIELRVDARERTGDPPYTAVSVEYFEFYYSASDRFTLTITKPDGTVFGPYPVGTDISDHPDPAVEVVYNDLDAGLHDIFVTFEDGAESAGTDWKFKIAGEAVATDGHFDVWLGNGDFDDDTLPDNAPPAYVDDSRKISSPGNSRGAITVGAFVSQSQVQPTGVAADFTSGGPTADGRAKPDISAPGRYLYSAKSFDSNFGVNPKSFPDAIASVYSAEIGTSMSTPVVTGAVALMLQANPNLSNNQIKRVLTNYADNDSFALPGWDPLFGYGKLNVLATLGAVLSAPTANPIYDSSTFVRRQYLDFLNREPDTDGLNAWLNRLGGCVGGDISCDRLAVSSSFFLSDEFRVKGYFIYRYYQATFGRRPLYTEILPDMRAVTGQTADERISKQNAFVNAWLLRPAVQRAYPDAISPTDFVNKLEQTTGVALGAKTQWINELANGAKTRAQVFREALESPEVSNRFYNEAFVAMQYFGYLRRDPEPAGFNDWLRVINANPADARTMVNGFAASTEYQLRFGYVPGAF